MTRSNSGLKILGLCGLALGLMCFMSSAAQAQAGAAWRVNGANITAPLKPGIKGVVENEALSLLSKILGIAVKILCKALSMTSTLGTEGGVNEGKMQYSGCATFLEGSATASAPCLPKTAGVNDVIETNAVLGLLVLVGGVGEILIKPSKEGGPLVVIESSAECAVGQKMTITGEIYLKDCQGKIKDELVTHLLEPDNVNSTVKISGQATVYDGSLNVTLTGAHNGLKWSGQPA